MRVIRLPFAVLLAAAPSAAAQPPAPRPPGLVASVPELSISGNPALLPPHGVLRLLYDAPVDSAAIARAARVELRGDGPACRAARTVPLQVVALRPVGDDDHELRWRGAYAGPDAAARRIVELRPATPLPPHCTGHVVLPSHDPADAPEVRWRIVTSPPFALAEVRCDGTPDCVADPRLHVTFNAPVRRADVARLVHVDGARMVEGHAGDVAARWDFTLPGLGPRGVVRVRIDTALRDVHGRRIAGRTRDSLVVADRVAAVGWEQGFLTIARRGGATLRVRHVNVDTVVVAFTRLAPQHAATYATWNRWRRGSPPGRLGERVKVAVPLRTPWNVERTTEVPLPAAVLRADSAAAWLVTLDADGPMRRPDRAAAVAPRRVPRARAGRRDSVQHLPPMRVLVTHALSPREGPLVVQVTDLAVHARIDDAGAEGSVLVTRLSTGRPVAGARAALRDARGRVVAAGVTDAGGLARLAAVPRADSEPADTTQDDPYGYTAARDGIVPSWPWWVRRRSAGTHVVVDADDDHAFVSLEHGVLRQGATTSYLSAYAWPHAMPATRRRAAAWTSRTLYRPGETVHLAAIVRHDSGGARRPLAPGDSLRLQVLREDAGGSVVVRDTVMGLSPFGTASDSFAIATGAPLGSHLLRAATHVGGEWHELASAHFLVAEFRPPAFTASAAVVTAGAMRGDSVRATLVARYLFGPPMPGARVSWSATLEELDPHELQIPGLGAGWSVGEGWSWWDRPSRDERSLAEVGADSLGSDGTLAVAVETPPGGTRPARVTFSASVEDADRQRAGATAEAVVHPATFYLAMRDPGRGWWWTAGVARPMHVLAVRPDGRRVAGVAVTARLVRRQWHADALGRWRPHLDTVATQRLTTADTAVQVAFVPRGGGSWTIALDATDEGGRPVRGSREGWTPGGAGWWGSGDDRLALALSASGARGDTASPGERATVRFVAPWPALAWLVVARDGVLLERRVEVPAGESRLELPVDARWMPGVTVSVALLRQVPAATGDSAQRLLRLGATALAVAPRPATLRVAVEPAARELRPGDSATVTVRVHDADGRPVRAEVTLWGADQGVLSLSGWRRPDPVSALVVAGTARFDVRSTLGTMAAGPLRLVPLSNIHVTHGITGNSSALSQSRVVSAEVMNALPVEEGAPTARLRQQFRLTAFWRAGIVTGADGAARVRVALPDNLTLHRLVAVAVTADDAYGVGEDSLRTALPLMARAAFPRFVRAGDTLDAGAVVNVRDTAARRVRVRADATGLDRRDTMPRLLALAGGRAAEARWRWTAADVDTVRLRVGAEDAGGAGEADAMATTLPVRPTWSPRAHALAGIARGTSTVRLALPPGLDPARSRLVLRAGTTPLPMVEHAYAWLRAYPYYCTEQLTSTGRALAALLRLSRAGLAPAGDSARWRGELQGVADQLARRQREDGGIGYWSRTHWTTAALSAEAGLLLLDARVLGVQVDSTLLERIAAHLAVAARDEAALPPLADTTLGTRRERARLVAERLGGRLAALRFLAATGEGVASAEDTLLARAGAMAWEDRVALAPLVAARGDARGARLLADAWRTVGLAGTRAELADSLGSPAQFPSRVRPAARLLLATLAVEPAHPRLAALVETVVAQGRTRGGWWWNTQDLAASAEALGAVAARARASPGTVRVRTTGGRVLLDAGADSAGVTLDGLLVAEGDSAALPLVVESRGAPAFWTITVHEVPRVRPVTPDERGMRVERWTTRFADSTRIAGAAAGELVRVRLRISVPADRDFVALADPLPAGLEAVDATLPAAAAELRAAGAAGAAADDGLDWWSPWEHRELRDDRIVFFARTLQAGTYDVSYVARATTTGTFGRPPAHAEEMYNPAANGRSDGGWFTVRDAPASP